MIRIVAKCIVKPEEINRFIAEAKPLIAASRQEAGCISYALHQDINNPAILTFIEEWKDEEAISIHNASEHFTTILPKLGELQEKESEVNLYREV